MKRRTDKQTTRLDAHVFVCVNERDSEYACCAEAGGEETAAAVKTWLRERDAFWSPVGVSTTDCLGLCSEAGTAITIQPHNEWFAEVRPDDVDDLMSEAFGPGADRI
ncbi:ferredoxin [Natronomonas sp. LN261]|uniref:(2Fe-2S) ferredoxin domain-containing protein n=1 Tax=Natronomonas sp. LN261 TaxID=2750669 RepID=UPI0015EE669E|nr:(2Fe-2S) ferredoxin domain-containing protein [Natronomonas sp. LN261]